MRSLAVLPERRERGTGRVLVEALESEARDNSLEAIFAFTYVPGFFARLGFPKLNAESFP